MFPIETSGPTDSGSLTARIHGHFSTDQGRLTTLAVATGSVSLAFVFVLGVWSLWNSARPATDSPRPPVDFAVPAFPGSVERPRNLTGEAAEIQESKEAAAGALNGFLEANPASRRAVQGGGPMAGPGGPPDDPEAYIHDTPLKFVQVFDDDLMSDRGLEAIAQGGNPRLLIDKPTTETSLLWSVKGKQRNEPGRAIASAQPTGNVCLETRKIDNRWVVLQAEDSILTQRIHLISRELRRDERSPSAYTLVEVPTFHAYFLAFGEGAGTTFLPIFDDPEMKYVANKEIPAKDVFQLFRDRLAKLRSQGASPDDGPG